MSWPTPSQLRGNDSTDALFSALAHENRRHVLRYFESSGVDVASLEELVDAIPRDERTDDRNRVVLRLHHVTLPKLEDAGIVEYDTRSNTVRYRGNPLLDRCLS